jgi:hypothetical protein
MPTEDPRSADISAHDALAIQPVVRAMHTATAEVEDGRAADQLQDWADRIAGQLAAALDGERS